MKPEVMIKILDTMSRWMTFGGGGGMNLAHVATWSGVPRSTTYRYLNKMIELGMVEFSIEPFRGGVAKFYRVAPVQHSWWIEEIEYE